MTTQAAAVPSTQKEKLRVRGKDEYAVIGETTEDILVFSNSLKVAEQFEKQHKNVLRDIENLGCSEEFRRLNYERTNYKDDCNRAQPAFNMTREGYEFLIMGFTGKKADKVKMAYQMGLLK